MVTGFTFDPDFLDHNPGAGHPECRERLESTISHLRTQPWFGELAPIGADPADPALIEAVHSADYMRRARRVCESGAPFLDSMDVGVSRNSYDIALKAAGAPLALAEAVIAQRISNGFALVRPPGHHAEHELALGFCLFNNVAVLARYLQHRHGVDKVLILDWDVHHGNGTQHTFEEDPSVMYVSLHQYPFYPGTGAASETGTGRGAGTTLNCPMGAGSTDQDYDRAFTQRILPALDAFRPEFVIISAGFDAHRDDPLGQIRLSTEFFGWMTERLMETADRHAGGRIVSVLEGGYNLQMLPRCVAEHLRVLNGASALRATA